MIAKWKLAAVMVAACVGLTGFGTWRGSAAPEAAATDRPTPAAPPEKAPPEKATPEKAPDAPKLPEVVATIFGDVAVTREAFADHLIRRSGQKELEPFVNKQIIAHAFAKKGWTIQAADVEAALDEDCKGLGITREQFAKDILPRYNKTLVEWTEDVITPRLMLSRLCKTTLPAVTEGELRQAFDVKYGEKLECRVIAWKKDEGDEARRAYEKIRDSEEEFDRHARRNWDPNLAAADGRMKPLPRTPPRGTDMTHVIASRLNAGDVSPLIPTANGFVVIKCDRVIPADKTRSFDKEKPMLLADVAQAKLNDEIPKLFKELKQEANPQYHLTFPGPVPQPGPRPTPAPKK